GLPRKSTPSISFRILSHDLPARGKERTMGVAPAAVSRETAPGGKRPHEGVPGTAAVSAPRMPMRGGVMVLGMEDSFPQGTGESTGVGTKAVLDRHRCNPSKG